MRCNKYQLILRYSGIAAVGAGFWKKKGNHRPFSPVDPDISFPYVEHEKISTGLLVTIALVIPALITAFVTLVFTPGFGVSRRVAKSLVWRTKLWECNTAWMGLALALATTFFFTEGLKNLIGRPRPDLLSRCNLDPAIVQQYALGGEGSQLPLWNLLVSSTACRQPDTSKLNDGFASFPSGHSSCTRLIPTHYLQANVTLSSLLGWHVLPYALSLLQVFRCHPLSTPIQLRIFKKEYQRL